MLLVVRIFLSFTPRASGRTTRYERQIFIFRMTNLSKSYYVKENASQVEVNRIGIISFQNIEVKVFPHGKQTTDNRKPTNLFAIDVFFLVLYFSRTLVLFELCYEL